MIQAAFFSAFDYVSKNRWAQIVLGVVVIYALLKMRDALRDRHTTARVKVRMEKKARKVQTRIEDSLDEKSAQTDIARDTAPAVSHADELPDDLRKLIIRD